MINVFQPALGQEELAAVAKVFESKWVGKGEWVNRFERDFAAHLHTEAEHFISTTSCTEGIFLSAELFKFMPGDEVIIPSISFIACASAVKAKGATPVFCDVNPETVNVSAEFIKEKITSRTKAVMLIHYGGVPCDMDPILRLCKSKGIVLIEDSACAVKSFYKGKACGTLGDMGLWSFDAAKTVCTGDGGMIYLKSEELVPVAKELLYHGFPNKVKSGMDSVAAGNPRWWEYEVNRCGRKAIMNNIAGAIGVAQCAKLDAFLARRRSIYERYAEELADCPWLKLPPEIPSGSDSSYYFFWVQLEKRDELAKFLIEHKVYTTFRYWPLHQIAHFDQRDVRLPNADRVSRTTLNIPLHQSLSDEDVSAVIGLIKQFGKQ